MTEAKSCWETPDLALSRLCFRCMVVDRRPRVFSSEKEKAHLAWFSADPTSRDTVLVVDLDSMLLERYLISSRNPHLNTTNPQRHISYKMVL